MRPFGLYVTRLPAAVAWYQQAIQLVPEYAVRCRIGHVSLTMRLPGVPRLSAAYAVPGMHFSRAATNAGHLRCSPQGCGRVNVTVRRLEPRGCHIHAVLALAAAGMMVAWMLVVWLLQGQEAAGGPVSPGQAVEPAAGLNSPALVVAADFSRGTTRFSRGTAAHLPQNGHILHACG